MKLRLSLILGILLLASLGGFFLVAKPAPTCDPSFVNSFEKFSGQIRSRAPLNMVYVFPRGRKAGLSHDLLTTELGDTARLRYIRYLGQGEFAEDESFPVVSTEHARQAVPILLHGKEAWVIADHGYDRPPFAGGQPRLLIHEKHGWRDETAERFPQMRSFNFNVAPLKLRDDGALDFFFGDVGSETQGDFILVNDGQDHFHRVDAPAELKDGCFMSALSFHSGEKDFLYAGACDRDRGMIQKERDRLFEVSRTGLRPLPQDFLPVRREEAGWGSVDLTATDLNQDGQTDLVTAVHNFGYTRGGIQIYRNRGDGRGFQTGPEDYFAATDKNRPAFIPFVHAGDLDNDSFPEIVAPLSPTMVKGKVLPLTTRYLLYKNNRGGALKEIGQCLPTSLPVLATADLVDLNEDGHLDLLLMAPDGRYEIYYFRPH